MKVSLIRVSIIDPGAFGVLLIDDEPHYCTVERSYTAVDGSQFTKIKPGRYLCTPTTYIKGGYKTFEIDVPGHSRILFHKGNIEDDVDGCVAMGMSWTTMKGKPAVLSSAMAFSDFMRRVGDQKSFWLDVA